MSPGEQLLDLVYIDDVVDAYCISGRLLKEGKVKGCESYAVSSNERIPLKEIIKLYAELSGKQLHIKWGGRPYRLREVMIPWENGNTLPGWQPKIKLNHGIKMMVHLDHQK